MRRPPSFSPNLNVRQSHKIPRRNAFGDRTSNNGYVIKREIEECGQNPDYKVHQNDQFKHRNFQEIATEVSRIIRTRPRWEQSLLSDFSALNFADPVLYQEVLKQQKNAFLSLRFYYWVRSQSGFLPDEFSCNLIFNALVEAKAAKAAKCFLDVTKFMPELSMLEPYIECLCEHGLVDEAMRVFDRLKRVNYCPELKTWNSAMSGSLRAGRAHDVRNLYNSMVENGVVADVDTVGYLIQALVMDDNLLRGYELLRQVLEAGHVPSKVVFNKLVRCFCMKGNYVRMSDLLHTMIMKNCSPDAYTYQEVINGLCKRKMKHEGFRIFNDLKGRGYPPDRVMYTTIIHGLCKMKWLGDAQKLWFEMIQKGFVPNEYTYNSLIYGYLKAGKLIEAERLFHEMCDKGYGGTTLSYNNIISGLSAHGKVEVAYDLFHQMAEKNISRDVITYNSLIRGFSKQGKIAEATRLLHELLNEGMQPTTPSYTVLIEKLCLGGHVQEGILLWKDMEKRGVIPAVCTHDAIIVGLCEKGSIVEGFEWLDNMVKNRLRPRKETFEKLFDSLSRADKVYDSGSALLLPVFSHSCSTTHCIYKPWMGRLLFMIQPLMRCFMKLMKHQIELKRKTPNSTYQIRALQTKFIFQKSCTTTLSFQTSWFF